MKIWASVLEHVVFSFLIVISTFSLCLLFKKDFEAFSFPRLPWTNPLHMKLWLSFSENEGTGYETYNYLSFRQIFMWAKPYHSASFLSEEYALYAFKKLLEVLYHCVFHFGRQYFTKNTYKRHIRKIQCALQIFWKVICLHTRKDVCFKRTQENKFIILSKMSCLYKILSLQDTYEVNDQNLFEVLSDGSICFWHTMLTSILMFQARFYFKHNLSENWACKQCSPSSPAETFLLKIYPEIFKMCHCQTNWGTRPEQLQESQYLRSALSAAYHRYIVFFRSKKKIYFSKLLQLDGLHGS